MTTAQFAVGDLVWAKMKGYPPWPAEIVDPPEIPNLPRSKIGHRCCLFLESANYSWIREDKIVKHSASMRPKSMKGKSLQFQRAVEIIFQLSSDAEDTNTEESQETVVETITLSSDTEDENNGAEENHTQLNSDILKKKSPRKPESHTQNTELGEMAAKKNKTDFKMKALRINLGSKKLYSPTVVNDPAKESSSPFILNHSSDMNATTSFSSTDETAFPSTSGYNQYTENNGAEIKSTAGNASKRKSSGGNVQKNEKRKQLNSDTLKKKSPRKPESHTQNTELGEMAAKKNKTDFKMKALRINLGSKKLYSPTVVNDAAKERSSALILNHSSHMNATTSFSSTDETAFPSTSGYNQYTENNGAEVKSTAGNASKRKSSGGNVQKNEKRKQLNSDTLKKKFPRKPDPHSQYTNLREEAVKKIKTDLIMKGLRIKLSKKKSVLNEEDNEDNESSSPLTLSHSSDMNATSYFTSRGETPFQSTSGYNQNIIPKRPIVPEYIERSTTPNFDINSAIDDIKDRNIEPSPMKIGFLGLGVIGRILAKRILISGHSLLVWNRSPEKCHDFIEAGACSLETPADVVAAADITFCCFSNPEAVNSIVFDNCGVLKGLSTPEGKGFCVLNTIGPQHSVRINDAIVEKGGLYLEAFVHGTRTMAETGQLLLVAGGSEELFESCTSCFKSFATDVFFANYEVGEAAFMNLLAHAINGVTCLLLSETLSYAEKNGVSAAELKKRFEKTRFSNPELLKNVAAMEEKDFSTDISVKFILQALDLAVDSSREDTVTLILDLVKEQYKKASLIRYFDHDITAIHQARNAKW